MTLTSSLAVVRYHLDVAFFRLRFNLYEVQLEKISKILKRSYIICRLISCGKDWENAEVVSDRYFCHQLHLQKKESKEAYHQLMDFISEWSRTTGIPQWEARALINRDFNIDV